MKNEVDNIERTQALYRHLSANETECINSNIIVRVDSINAAQSVALCSVEQRRTGPFRHSCTVHELIRRAEQALAPMVGMGIVPLITVRHKSLMNTSDPVRTRFSIMDWIRGAWYLLGFPQHSGQLSALPVQRDPFGWRRALTSSATK